jgi:hypothetical protein
MSKFKDALERGKEARREQEQQLGDDEHDRDAAAADFSVQAREWLKNVVVASLEVAKAEVAGEVTIHVDTKPLEVKRATPSVRFQIYKAHGSRETQEVPRTYTVSVQVDGGVSVSAPGIVAKDAGDLGNKSGDRFTTLVAELIEEAAKDT